MSVRQLVRGTVPWETVEAVGQEIASRYGRPRVRIEFLEAENWLSTPLVVDRTWFVKVITARNAFVHAVFTGARNLGAVSSGTEGFFEHFGTPLEMAEHELEAAQRMQSVGVNVPEPVEAFEVEDYGVLVFEYVPAFRTFEAVEVATARQLAPDLFVALDRMHQAGLAHGDLRSENVLVVEDELYFIDATSVRGDIADARAYDIACALGVLSPLLGPAETVGLAVEIFGAETLLTARDFLDFVTIRPDHDFDAAAVKGEIEKVATG